MQSDFDVTFVAPDSKELVFRVDRQNSLAVGRDPKMTLVLPQPVISASHCRLFCAETGELCIVDTSSNGTFVNGKRLSKDQPQVLQSGAFICLVLATLRGAPLRSAPLRSEVDSMSTGERTRYVGYFRCTPAEESS